MVTDEARARDTDTDPRRRRGAALLLAVLGLCAAPAAASATPTIAVTVGNDPVESITTQVGVTGNVDGPSRVQLTVKPGGGAGCASNFSADSGDGVIDTYESAAGPYTVTVNRTFGAAGTYLLCGYVQSESSPYPTVAATQRTIAVRQPKLAVSVNAPATVTTGDTFQLTATAQAETTRELYVLTLPDTGRGCPANAAAAGNTSGSNEVFDTEVTGGPTTLSSNLRFSDPGVRLVCGYFEYPNSSQPPEATAQGSFTVVSPPPPPPPPPPCVVPSVTAGARLADAKSALVAAHCTSGRTSYIASARYARGLLISFNPKPGTQLDNAAPVRPIVSLGAPCVVPGRIRGMRPGAAKAAVVRHGCAVGRIVRRRSATARKGRIFAVSVPTSTRLKPLTPVDLYVSRGRR